VQLVQVGRYQQSAVQLLQMVIIGVVLFVGCGKFVFTFSSMAVTDSMRFEVLTALTAKITVVM
jgi:hypothetical protein